MAYAVYTARRGLVTYHTAEQDYAIDFDTLHGVRPSGSDLKTVQNSIDGTQETQFYGEQRIWTINTAPVLIGSAEEQLLLEFLRSTADGQSFTFDPYGRSDNDVLPLVVQRADSGYSEDVFQEIDGMLDYVKFSFRVLEA